MSDLDEITELDEIIELDELVEMTELDEIEYKLDNIPSAKQICMQIYKTILCETDYNLLFKI